MVGLNANDLIYFNIIDQKKVSKLKTRRTPNIFSSNYREEKVRFTTPFIQKRNLLWVLNERNTTLTLLGQLGSLGQN